MGDLMSEVQMDSLVSRVQFARTLVQEMGLPADIENETGNLFDFLVESPGAALFSAKSPGSASGMPPEKRIRRTVSSSPPAAVESLAPEQWQCLGSADDLSCGKTDNILNVKPATASLNSNREHASSR